MLVLAGCALARQPALPGASTEQAWVLIENPRRNSGQDEPEYEWVRDDAIPGTLNTLLFGKRSIIAAPEVAARHAPPPESGRISALQGGPYAANAEASARRGYVVYVDDKRVVVDLAARQGAVSGMLLSIRREGTALVHPVTGQSIGALDEEVATARIVEVRENFSVAEIETTQPGARIKIQDRAVPRM